MSRTSDRSALDDATWKRLAERDLDELTADISDERRAVDRKLRADSHELGQQLRWRSSRWRSSRDSLWSVHDRQVAIFDRGDAPMRKVVGTGKYHPAVDRIPWDARWKPPSTAGGNHDQLCYIDTAEGWRYGLWMPSYPAKILWGLWRLGGTVGAGAAWVCSSPAVDGKGRVVPGDPADMRTYRGNDPRCNGAGVIPRPLTRAQLDAGRIGHALSAVVANDTFGPAGLVCAPAGKIEGGPGSMSVGGVRFAWRYADGTVSSVTHTAAAWTGDGAVFLSWGLVDTFAGDAIPSGGWAIGIPFGTAAQGWS